MGLPCFLRNVIHLNRPTTFCVQRFLRLKSARLMSSYVPKDGLNRSEEELESLRKAQEFLDGLKGPRKKKLELIELQFEIMKANQEPVPDYLSSKQKKAMIIGMKGKDEWIDYMYNLRRSQMTKEKRQEEQRESPPDIVFRQYMLADSFYPRIMFFRSRMAHAFDTGMPIVIDAGCQMDNLECAIFLQNLSKTYQVAKAHSFPPHLIVSGLRNNKVLLEILDQRVEYQKMMVDYRLEPYWELFPTMPIVYFGIIGQEYHEKIDGSALYVIQGSHRYPKLAAKANEARLRTLPFHNSIFARSGGTMMSMKVKLLTDLSVERDVVKVYRDNVYSDVFKKYMSDVRIQNFNRELRGQRVEVKSPIRNRVTQIRRKFKFASMK